jgi:hypothetical protein
VRPALLALSIAVLACAEPTPPPTAAALPPPPTAPVRLHAQAWEHRCGGDAPDPKGRCQLNGLDEDEDGSVVVTGGFEGTAPFFGESATAASFRSLVLARISPDGKIAWKKLVGAKVPRDESASVGEQVVMLGGGQFGLSGFHGPGFDLGSGPLPTTARRGGASDDGFVAVLGKDGSPVFAANLDTLLGKDGTQSVLPLRPLGLHLDGKGGFWAVAGRTGEPLAAVHLSGRGDVLGRATYPAVVRFDTPANRLELRSQGAPDRVLGVFGSDSLSLARALAVGRDGTLFVADADGTGQRGLVLHRFSPGGALADVRLDPPEQRTSHATATPAAGPNGEVYVAATTEQLLVEKAIVGGQVIPRLLRTEATVQRVDPDGQIRWTWTAGPSTNLVFPHGVVARAGAVRVILTHRDDLQAAPGVKVPSPSIQPVDSAGRPALSVLSLTEDGRVTALDGMTAQGPCPSWIPALLRGGFAAGRRVTVLSNARDQDKPGACSQSFGFNGGNVIASIPASASP